MKKSIIYSVFGLFTGVIITILMIILFASNFMFEVHPSRFNFEKTVAEIQKVSTEAGWKIPKIYNFQKTFQKAGYDNIAKMKVLSLCQPHHAMKLLGEDSRKPIMAMMPCRIGVYENESGQVFVTQMNLALFSHLFDKETGEIMRQVAIEEQVIFESILK